MVNRLTDTGNGSGLAGDLRYCLTQATSGKDVIDFSMTGTISLTKALPTLNSTVSIDGPGAGLLTIQRDTGGSYRVFTVGKGVNVELSGLTVAGGTSSLLGGGIYNDGTLTINGMTLSGNTAGMGGGGGIYNSPSGSLTINNSTVSNNKVLDPSGTGGGILNDGVLTINGCTMSGNRAGGGAGIYSSSSGTLTVSKSTISSNSGANDGGGIYSGGTLTVADSTIMGNTAIDSGGGILSSGALTVSNTTFSGNVISDAFGSALDASGGPVRMTQCTITNNMAHTGRGAVYLNAATATLDQCTISGNASQSGGGLVNVGTLTVSKSTISGNTASGPGSGGGVLNNGTLTISTSTISGNSGWAGGLWNSGMLAVSNSTISGNSCGAAATQTAGGIADAAQKSDATVTLLCCTVANNTVNTNSSTGSQLYSGRTATGTGKASIELRNTIVSGEGTKPNFFADTGGSFLSDGHNLSSDNGNRFLTGPGDLINTNPLLSPLQDNRGPAQTMALLPGSPAIDAGDNTNAPATDERGFARVVNSTIDIGAFESRGFTMTAASGGNQQTMVNTAFPSSLQVSVNSPFGEPVQGGLITFSAPTSGASATFAAVGPAAIDSTGQASIAATANSSTGSYTVTASAKGTSSASFSLTNLPAITLSPTNLPHGRAGITYSQTLTASGGAGGPFSFAVIGGLLPAGFALSSSGVLSGNATMATTTAFTATATGAGGYSASVAYTLTIEPGSAAIFVVTGFPVPVTAGVAGSLTIIAKDAFGNVATGYAGSVIFSSSDPQASLPIGLSLSAGMGTASATLRSAGSQSLTASDAMNASITGSQSGIAVDPAAATRFVLAGPSDATAGTPLSITVQAVDAFGNTAAGYLGTAAFASTDPGIVLPSDYTFNAIDSGVHVFTNGVTLRTPGSQTITATDTLDSSIHGSISLIVNLPVFLVTNTLDSGAGSLRQAILDANATSGLDLIQFAVDRGMQTINLASPLPAISQPVLIDGTSQPGYGNAPLIELNGAGAGPDADGLLITAGNSVVRGLIINRFSINGIELRDGGGDVLQGNYIGTDATGTMALGNGVGLRIGSANNTIGGTMPGAGNLISGNLGDGILIADNGTGNTVVGNLVGTDASGSANLGNAGNGVDLERASGNTIGGTPAGAANVIAYNGGDGVLVDSGSGNAIRGNSIYTHTSGLGIELTNGGNQRLPFPVLTSASSDGTTVTILGQLQSTPNTVITLDFFANRVASSSGFGEGQQFLGTGTVTTNSHGTASFTIALDGLPLGQFVAATATDPENNTSSFSNSLEVTGVPTAPLPGRNGTEVDTAGLGSLSFLNSFPQPDAHTGHPISVLESSHLPLERRIIDIFFGKRNQKALRAGDMLPMRFPDASF
jgi:hypothetical protein